MIITHNGTILTNDGVVLNNITTSPSFQNTYSLDFDGVDDYVDVGEIPPLFKKFPIGTAKDNPWSASMWVKGSTSGAFLQLPYGEINSLSARAFAFAFTGTYLYFGGKFANIKIRESEPFAGGVTAFSTTDWNHVLMTFDGVDYTALSSYKLYVNGTLIPIELIPVNITDFRVESILIGGVQLPWLGKIDEVSLFDAKLTTTNVTSIYNGGKPTDLTPLNPIAWYRMGDNGAYKDPQWLIPSNENKDKVSNYSMEFDGVNDYIDLGSSSTVADGGQFSLSFWIKGNTQPIGAKYLFSADYYNLHTFWTIQNTELYWRNINNNYKLLSTNLLDGEWHHILIIWNPDGANSTIRCFTDGVNEVNIATDFRYAPGWNGGAYQGGLQYIGNRGGGTFPGFNGSIDEFAVWDNDQSSNILSIYNGGTPTTISGAVAHYKMGEEATFSGGVWTVPDQIGSNDGTSANMTIEDRVGTAPSSSNNALSFNMDLIDRVEDTPPS